MLFKKIFSKRFFVKFLRFIFIIILCIRKITLFYSKFKVRLFKLTNAFSPCAKSLAPFPSIELWLKFFLLLKKNFSNEFIWNFFALSFSLFYFRKVSLFYSKIKVRLFKLTNVFSPSAKALAPSFSIELSLKFCY